MGIKEELQKMKDREEATGCVIRSIRADAEVFERFKEITASNFKNQGAALAALISVYERDQAESKVPGTKDIIREVTAHQNAINRLFSELLEQNIQKETVVREEMRTEIDVLRRENEELKKKCESERKLRLDTLQELQAYKDSVEEYKQQLQEQEEENSDLRKLIKLATQEKRKDD